MEIHRSYFYYESVKEDTEVEDVPSHARGRAAGGTSGAEQDVVDGLREQKDGKRPDFQAPEHIG